MPMNLRQARLVDPITTKVVQGFTFPSLSGGVLFPSVPVPTSGGQVVEFGKEAFQAVYARRAPGANTRRVTLGYQGKPYALLNERLEGTVPRELLREASRVPGIDLATRSTRTVMNILKLNLEREQAAIATDPASYAASNKLEISAAGDRWDNDACVIGSQIEAGREAIRAQVGVYPNTLLLSPRAFSAAKVNPSVIERFKYSTREAVTEELLANLWGVRKVVVASAVTADQAGAFLDIWGDAAILAYVPEVVGGQEEPSYGYTYELEGHPLVEEPYFDNNTASWVYPVAYERAPVLPCPGAGYLISGTRTPAQ